MSEPKRAIGGRGSSHNPRNRFEPLAFVPDGTLVGPKTRFLRDTSRSIIAYNDSPDVGFEASVNPYRGCEHGCIYCYARPTHEYLGFSAGLDFETRILVKEDAPELLRKELSSPRWKPQVIALCGVTDPYQPAERRLELTRRCLEVLAAFRNPVAIVTKNHMVTRDVDILKELAARDAAVVFISVTTLDNEICGRMEPRTSQPRLRLDAIRTLSEAGVPAGVLVAPVVPGLTDHETPAILAAAAEAGAGCAGYSLLRLPFGVKDLFEQWLEENYPDRKDKVLNRVREFRGGRLNDPGFRSRMKGQGIFAEQVEALFDATCRKLGLTRRSWKLSTAAFRRDTAQLPLFGG
ncbi:MAG: PA0069 family radical SAM protein [Deltaproteobacteria bacterium]|nr:PA0069 family radical SAM protein [Deltaproteobacteria bacterium]